MQASVQYNDFKGTSAADISDHDSLDSAAERIGVDTSRYRPIGARFYSGYKDHFSAAIIARDEHNSQTGAPYLVEFSLQVSREDFFDLFKRFEVIVHDPYTDYSDVEVRETIDLHDS